MTSDAVYVNNLIEKAECIKEGENNLVLLTPGFFKHFIPAPKFQTLYLGFQRAIFI